MSRYEHVRAYAYSMYVVPARLAGQTTVTIRAGPLHELTGYRTFDVCEALRTQKFMSDYGLKFVSRGGPKAGLALTFTFGV